MLIILVMPNLSTAESLRSNARVRANSYADDLVTHMRTYHDVRQAPENRALALALATLVIESEEHARMRSAIPVESAAEFSADDLAWFSRPL